MSWLELGECEECGEETEVVPRYFFGADGENVEVVACQPCAEERWAHEREFDDGAAGVRRPTLRVLDMAHMLSTEPPAVPWFAEPLLVGGNVTMLAGREGQGKSMLALALAAAIGEAATVAGISCSPGRALYVDAENGPGEIHRRVRGLGVRPGTLVYVEADRFDLRNDFGEIEALVDEHEPSVLMLDSLRSLAPGLDENDSKDTEAALRPVVRFAQRMGIATLILHHAGKSGVEYRGSTAIGSAVELGFTMSRHDEDPEKQTRRKLACWKCRPAAEPAARWISLGVNAGGRILLDEAEPFEPTREAPARDDVAAELREYLDGLPLAGGVSGCQGVRGVDTVTPSGIPDDNGDSRVSPPAPVTPSWTTADLARVVGRDPKDQTVRRALERLAVDGVLHRGEDKRWHPLGPWFHSNGNGVVA